MAVGRKTGGRQKGMPNKTTAALREAILVAAEDAMPGGRSAISNSWPKTTQARSRACWERLLTLAGDPVNPIHHEVDLTIYSDENLKTMIRILGHGKTNVRDLSDTRRD